MTSLIADLTTRFRRLPGPPPGARLRLRTGGLKDYAVLAEHHYKAKRPATATRVLIESLPSLSCRMRDWGLHERYGGHLMPRSRAMMLNSELRCISRVVIDPRWRGLGLAVRLVRCALAEPTTIYTEALAAMGKVNPFFERAGMTAYPRPVHGHDARFIAALGRVGLTAQDLAVLGRTFSTINELPPSTRAWLLKELYRWYRLNAGRSAVHETDPCKQLIVARERLLLEPVYYLKDHRDL